MKKIIFTSLLILTFKAYSFESKCSKENIVKLLTEYGNLAKLEGKFSNNIHKRIINRKYHKDMVNKDPTISELRNEFKVVIQDLGEVQGKSVKAIEEILNKSPECEEWSIFKY